MKHIYFEVDREEFTDCETGKLHAASNMTVVIGTVKAAEKLLRDAVYALAEAHKGRSFYITLSGTSRVRAKS